MYKIFDLIEKSPNDPLTVEEFIESYIYYEEHLKIKIIKIEKFLDDLTEEKKKLEEDKKHAEEDEHPKSNGLTNKSNLFVTILEGKNFQEEGVMGSCNPFVQIEFQGSMEKSLVKKNNTNPTWNENFKFEIKEKRGVVKVEVLNETLLGNKSFGHITISLNDLINQEEILSWFDLNTGKGKIKLKILCVINLVNYYDNQINKTISDLKNLKKFYNELSVYQPQMTMPFGLIYTQNLEPLLDKEKLKKSEDLLENLRNRQKSESSSPSRKENQIRNINSSEMNTRIKWNKITQILMMLLIALTFLTLLERSDFLNLFLGIIILVLFLIDKNNNVEKYLQPLILTIGLSLIYDFIWFITQFWDFVSDTEHPERKLKRFIYLISIGNFLIKGCLVKGLNDVKRKKLYNSFLYNN